MGRKDQGNWKILGNNQAHKKEVEYSQIKRRGIWYVSPEDVLMQYQVMGCLLISLTYILFGLVSQWNDNPHEVCMSLILKYEVSKEKQEIINEVTNRWNTFRNKDTSQYPRICFNELDNLNLNLNNNKVNYERDKD